MAIITQLMIGTAVSYWCATVSESFLHRNVLHATSRMRRFWAKHPRLCGPLIRAHYRHAVVHHGLTFQRDHVTQFRDADERRRTDAIVAKARDRLIEREHYGLRIGLRGLLSYNMTVLPVLPLLYRVVGPWAALGGIPMLLLAPGLAMVVHQYLHLSHPEAVRTAPRWIALILKTRYFRWLARHHYLHHVDPRSNFNLLIGGDLVLGTYRRASQDDLRAMREIGLRVD